MPHQSLSPQLKNLPKLLYFLDKKPYFYSSYLGVVKSVFFCLLTNSKITLYTQILYSSNEFFGLISQCQSVRKQYPQPYHIPMPNQDKIVKQMLTKCHFSADCHIQP